MTFPQIRNLSKISREAPVKRHIKIGVMALMWIISLLVPIYAGINLLYEAPSRKAQIGPIFHPPFIQLGVLFVATVTITGITQLQMMRSFSAVQASHDQSLIRTRAPVEKAMKTAALQFLSASCLQVWYLAPRVLLKEVMGHPKEVNFNLAFSSLSFF